MSDPLPPAAQAVWGVYLAMAETKNRHFDYLQTLENKYQKYDQANAVESAHRQQLLQAHDKQVKRFRGELAKLRIEDPKAYGALLQRLANQDP